jgi:hypothetical protein
MATLTETQPTITFDFETHTVTMTVIVTPKAGSGEFNIETAPVSLPLQTWNMIWELISEGDQAVFTSIVFPPPPVVPSGNVTISNSQGGGSQWTATIHNQVGSFNGFNYTINVEPAVWPDPGPPPISSSEDPSIAVTPDPPPGG